MISEESIRRLFRFLPVLCLLLPTNSFADVLISINGEQFIGRIIEEKPDAVIFESKTAGRLTLPRSQIRDLHRGSPSQAGETNGAPATAAAGGGTTNTAWKPPGLGVDGFDWIKLKSEEWLRGELRYVQDKKVVFESDKLEELSLKLKDVRQIYPVKPMFTKFDGREQVFGTVSVSNDVVEVVGPEQVRLPREELTGITPGGSREVEFWSGKLSVGVNLQAGNSKQATFNSSAELARRTPATQFLVNYLGNFSEVNGDQNANNHRVNLSYDVRLDRHWFLRPVQWEYYRDQLANLAHRATVGVGVGYYIFDSDDLEWNIAAGPGYQYSQFETVAAGDSSTASTAAGILQTKFKADITDRLTFKQSFSSTLASEAAGLYTHHAVTTLEFEIKKHLDLDVSLVWDYLQNPQPESTGVVPQRNDFRLTLGMGVKF